MKRMKAFVSLFCAWTAAIPAVYAQRGANAPLLERSDWHSSVTYPYRAKEVAPIDLGNSNRIENLMRGGQIYLSLQDAIALALENNLDIEIQRYGLRIAETNLMAAKAGGSGGARSISTAVAQGPTGATGRTTGGTQIGDLSGGTSAAMSVGGIPSLDPELTGSIQWGHYTQPQTNSFIYGSTSVISTVKNNGFTLSKGFLTGTRTSLAISNRNVLSSSGRADFNPSTTANLNLNITQPLLQGFGRALNSRNIRIARNNIDVADLTFRQQAMTTVSSVISLYWDLVSFNEDVKVRKQALALAEKLYNDNKKQVEIGTLAPIEIVRAEAEVAARQQDLLVAETQVLQQETILKNALSRTGVASPALADARIIPTDRIRVPDLEAIEPIQDLIAKALDARPELFRTRVQLENAKINLKAARNGLLPQLNAFVNVQNNALSGQINELPVPSLTGLAPQPRDPRAVDQFFIGGYGNVLSQIFRRNFPDYAVGVQLSIPLRNRAAQADMVNAQLSLRQNELQQQKDINQVRVDVQNALIAVQQARARHQTATKNRILQEQTLDAEQKKYALGASTIFFVIQAQRDLATAQANEVTALSQYARARVELDRAVGRTLEANNIMIDEVKQGQISWKPAQLPLVAPRN